MSIVAEEYDYVMGVDTHAEHHSYVLINAATAATVAGPKKFPTTAAGLRRAVNWCHHTSGQANVLWAVEGTGCYGKLLTVLLAHLGSTVAEVRPPKKGGPKTDALDAAAAARAVLRVQTDQLTQPRRGQLRQALQIACTARHALNKDVTATTQRLIALTRTNTLDIDARHGLSHIKIAAIAAWRPRRNDPIDITIARRQATTWARHIIATRIELKANEKLLHSLLTLAAPELLSQPGVGPITAAQLLLAYSHHGRFTSEAAFAMHAGVAPIPTGSGKTDGTRVRLNPGNDRTLNSAIYYITRSRIRHSERTKTYIATRAANGHHPNHTRRMLTRYVIRDLYRTLTTLNLPDTPQTLTPTTQPT